MDPFNIDNVKVEKANAMKRYHRLKKIAHIFRILEVFLVSVFILWFSTRVPNVFQASGKYFKDLGVVLVSPRFVFLVGNVIILTLFVKSGQFSGKHSAGNSSGSFLYEEFVKNSENRQKIRAESPLPVPDEIVYEDKQTVCEEGSTTYFPREAERRKDAVESEIKRFRRTKSENLKRELCVKQQKELRRSETEKCCTVQTFEKETEIESESARVSYAEEDMSNEEFQRTIEAFIAKQLRFHREESMAIVLHN